MIRSMPGLPIGCVYNCWLGRCSSSLDHFLSFSHLFLPLGFLFYLAFTLTEIITFFISLFPCLWTASVVIWRLLLIFCSLNCCTTFYPTTHSLDVLANQIRPRQFGEVYMIATLFVFFQFILFQPLILSCWWPRQIVVNILGLNYVQFIVNWYYDLQPRAQSKTIPTFISRRTFAI